jgi:phosphoribosylanthranilate isomerase
MSTRTRIKICGITRAEDLHAAVAAGADAVGFVFYPPSQRYLSIVRARDLAGVTPPFVTRVGLFADAKVTDVREVLATVPLELLQFHGDEDEAYCRQFGRPYIKAARVRTGLDLLEYARTYSSASGLLLDAFVDGFGGAGQCFDWDMVPAALPLPIVLAGGLTSANVAEAVLKLRPFAVDVSSGVESGRGIKDAEKIATFVAAVREADLKINAGQ